MPMTLTQADAIASSVLAKASELALEPMAVAVVDPGGHVLVVKREEDAGFFYADMVVSKAWSSVAIGRAAAAAGGALAERGVLGALTKVSGGKFLPLRGSVLVRNQSGEIMGAVGVAGPSGAESDEQCAIYAVEALALVAEV